VIYNAAQAAAFVHPYRDSLHCPWKGGENMSAEALEEILRKASSDAQFRNRLQTDLEGAVRGFDLTEAEKQQLQAGAGDVAVPAGAAPEQQAAARAAAAVAQSAVAQSAVAQSTLAQSNTVETLDHAD
jgi:hypothetical protein